MRQFGCTKNKYKCSHMFLFLKVFADINANVREKTDLFSLMFAVIGVVSFFALFFQVRYYDWPCTMSGGSCSKTIIQGFYYESLILIQFK